MLQPNFARAFKKPIFFLPKLLENGHLSRRYQRINDVYHDQCSEPWFWKENHTEMKGSDRERNKPSLVCVYVFNSSEKAKNAVEIIRKEWVQKYVSCF